MNVRQLIQSAKIAQSTIHTQGRSKMKVERIFNVLLVLVLLLSVGVQLSQAQVRGPEAKPELQANAPDALVASRISYQGVLKESGSPVTGARDMTFRFFTTTDCSGAALQTIVKAGVTVTNGLFSTTLDVTASNFNGQALYVQVQIGGTNISCQALLPVPYALSLRSGARIGGSGAGDGDLYLYKTDNTRTFHLNGGSGELFLGGTGEDGDIYIKNDANTTTFDVNGQTGHVTQARTGNGLVKAGVFTDCSSTASITPDRSFNNVDSTVITVAGNGTGDCTIDFGFDVSDRYVVAVSYKEPAEAFATVVTFGVGADNEKLTFRRYQASTGSANTGRIMVLVY